MKRLLTVSLTLGVLAVMLWSGLRSSPGPADRVPPPADTSIASARARVQALLDAARKGDVSRYLDCFAGPLRARLARQVTEQGVEAFGATLRDAAASRRGHALFDPEPDGSSALRVVVESVYPDRNERQTLLLAHQADGSWRVTGLETTRTALPASSYGSPATFNAPEGTPVSP